MLWQSHMRCSAKSMASGGTTTQAIAVPVLSERPASSAARSFLPIQVTGRRQGFAPSGVAGLLRRLSVPVRCRAAGRVDAHGGVDTSWCTRPTITPSQPVPLGDTCSSTVSSWKRCLDGLSSRTKRCITSTVFVTTIARRISSCGRRAIRCRVSVPLIFRIARRVRVAARGSF